MAHKKFIENPLGVRLSKKESLLIPLQEQEERIPACFLSDLYGPRNKGYGGKDTSLPSRGLAPGSLWAAILAVSGWLFFCAWLPGRLGW